MFIKEHKESPSSPTKKTPGVSRLDDNCTCIVRNVERFLSAQYKYKGDESIPALSQLTCQATLKMTTPNALRLELATPEDIPDMVDLWFEAFKDPDMQRLWPGTPGVRKWWHDANYNDIINKPLARYVKVVDPDTLDAQGRPRIAAYAKWDTAMPEELGRRYPPWHEDMPSEECQAFFKREEDERKRVMGDYKHYCTEDSTFWAALELIKQTSTHLPHIPITNDEGLDPCS